MPHPSEYRSPAYRLLLDTLGESDATVEWIEVGVRHIDQVSKVEGAPGVQALAVMHGVCVSPIDIAQLRHRVARLQILAVHQQAEDFFRNFHQTHPRRVEYNRKTDEDALTATLRVFGVTFSSDQQLEVDLFHYYRQVRNRITHAPRSDSSNSQRKLCEQLRAQVAQSSYHKLCAPNPISELQFDDFVLFTRSLKQLATNLSASTSPTDGDYVVYLRQNDLVLAGLRPFGNNRRRSETFLVNFLRTSYSLSAEHAMKIAQQVLDTARSSNR